MECQHAYLDRDIDYVLCDKEPKPNRFDRTALFHAVCAHQAHCPKQNCHKLTASWLNCVKLSMKPQDGAGEHFDEALHMPEETPKKRSRRATKPDGEE